MNDSQFAKSCHFFKKIGKQCTGGKKRRHRGIHPLSDTCCCGRVKVCSVQGDRETCARMAHMGVLPGTELELICPNTGSQCMVKINGSTLSLDHLAATNIMVTASESG